MLDDQLLLSYISGFYGYGSYSGRYWFVGMEEGGGRTFEENAGRIAVWDERGRREIDDLAEYHHAIGVPRYFDSRPPVQTTWGKLIRVVLAAGGEPVTLEGVRAYQRDRLGRSNDETCLLELLPLPSPSTGQWMYGEHTSLSHLRTREEYREQYARPRAQHLAARVAEHRPAAVVFYSLDGWYRQWWELIAGVEFEQVAAGSDSFYLGSNGHTVFAIVKHPATMGLTNDYFHTVGRAITSTEAQAAEARHASSSPLPTERGRV